MFTLKTLNKLAVASAVAVAVSFAAAATTDKKGTNRGVQTTPPSASAIAADNIRTAAALVRYGDANKDASALIVAARMVKDAGGKDEPLTRTAGTAGEPKAGGDRLDAESILKRAREYAGGRADLIAMADEVAKSGSRGAAGGPKFHRDVIGARRTDTYRVAFRGGESARIVVSGDGDSDLDLYVYDENGNLVCKDDDDTDDMVCGWNPRWTGQFRIEIKNRGGIANAYRLVTN